MSEIDSYRHECMGMVSCPSSYLPNSTWRHPERVIPLYRLGEDAVDADSFKAQEGDLLLGGGSGECPTLRISVPGAFYLFGYEDGNEPTRDREVCHAHWTMNDAFIFGDGYVRSGWQPLKQPLEYWLAEHLLAFVIQEYPEIYGQWKKSSKAGLDGSICRRPTPEELTELGLR